MTKTMEMVSSAKMKKAMVRVAASRPYAKAVLELLVRLRHQRGLKHELFRKRQPGKTLYVIIGSDRGLCGGYNSRIERLVRTSIIGKSVDVVTLGKKMTQMIRRAKKPLQSFVDLTSETPYREIQDIGKRIEEIFTTDKAYEKVFIVHTQFTSALNPTTVAAQILPLELESLKTVYGIEEKDFLEKTSTVTTIEPSEEVLANELVPDLFRGLLYQYVIEAYASEQALRMAAMKQATDNANDLQEQLFFQYNRARQAAVTQEITEIMNTSAALS